MQEHIMLGGCDNNPIKLSLKTALFSSGKDSAMVTTESENWWLSEISLDENPNYDLSGVNKTARTLVIERPEFRIERKDKTHVHIYMPENETNKEKVLTVYLQAGNCFDWIRITQSAD